MAFLQHIFIRVLKVQKYLQQVNHIQSFKRLNVQKQN